MDKDEARQFLSSILNRNLRVITTDGRMFWGSFKCTDAVCHPPTPYTNAGLSADCFLIQDKNIVLANTYEYRQPSMRQQNEAAEDASIGTVSLDMRSRYLGLVVVPGPHIVKMEVEEFASQIRGRGTQF